MPGTEPDQQKNQKKKQEKFSDLLLKIFHWKSYIIKF
jgi:hypothetical protein